MDFNMNKTIFFQIIPDDFDFPLWHKITYSSLSLMIIIIGLAIHQRLWIFLKRQGNARPVDRIIKCQTIFNCFMTPIGLTLLNFLSWNLGALKDWITPPGCYVSSYFLQYFHPYYLQFHSFTMAIFRYGCILHPEKVRRLGSNGPQKFATVCTLAEVLLALVVAFAGWIPTTPESQSSILACLDHHEVFYDFDYFTPGGHSRSKAYCQVDNIFAWSSCIGILVFGSIIGSNCLEIGLNYSFFRVIKHHTNKSAWLLSKKDFCQRKRDNKLIMTVTFWQWMFELGISAFFGIMLFTLGTNRAMEHFYVLIHTFLTYVVMPAFFLFHDMNFRREWSRNGIRQAILKALRQDY